MRSLFVVLILAFSTTVCPAQEGISPAASERAQRLTQAVQYASSALTLHAVGLAISGGSLFLVFTAPPGQASSLSGALGVGLGGVLAVLGQIMWMAAVQETMELLAEEGPEGGAATTAP